jgi:hypothetical protein
VFSSSEWADSGTRGRALAVTPRAHGSATRATMPAVLSWKIELAD